MSTLEALTIVWPVTLIYLFAALLALLGHLIYNIIKKYINRPKYKIYKNNYGFFIGECSLIGYNIIEDDCIDILGFMLSGPLYFETINKAEEYISKIDNKVETVKIIK